MIRHAAGEIAVPTASFIIAAGGSVVTDSPYGFAGSVTAGMMVLAYNYFLKTRDRAGKQAVKDLELARHQLALEEKKAEAMNRLADAYAEISTRLDRLDDGRITQQRQSPPSPPSPPPA